MNQNFKLFLNYIDVIIIRHARVSATILASTLVKLPAPGTAQHVAPVDVIVGNHARVLIAAVSARRIKYLARCVRRYDVHTTLESIINI